MDPIAAFTAALAPHVRVDHELLGGGMARVFVGEDLRLGRRVVVKVLSPERAAALDRTRFTREVETIARLQHPNVVPILWSGEEAGLPFFVMPYVTGRSLRVRLQQDGAFTPTQAIPILRDVLRALAVAHAAGIIHRDIKPDNVLLTPDGAAMVSDFGIAKLLATPTLNHTDAPHATMAGTSLGTPAYMAPEQAAADPDADHRVDLYAFGVVAYEMLAGAPPFVEARPQALLAAHIAKAPPPLQERVPLVPPELADLVMRCLAKAPGDRFASAAEILALLETATSSSGHAVVRPMPRGRRLLRATSGLALAGIAGVLAMRHFRRPPLDAGLVAVAPFRVTMPDSALAFLRDGLPDLLAAASLTGEGGPRAIDTRTSQAAFRAAAKGAAADLPVARALDAARDLGVGRLLLGEVLPARDGIEIAVTPHDVARRTAGTRLSVVGSRDSVPQLIEALGAQLLTLLAGDSVRRATGMGSVPLPALRAYLEGRTLLGRMKAREATSEFMRAIELDSTFALAGIGIAMSTGWYGDQAARRVGLDVAVHHRDRLGPKDAALLETLVGPHYPEIASLSERFATAQAYVAIAPERADAWYILADLHFHYGLMAGERDWFEQAETGFRRALRIDSTYAPGYSHLAEIANLTKDHALRRRLDALQKMGGVPVTPIDQWLRATVDGDSAALRALWADPSRLMGSVIDYGDFAGIGVEDAWRGAQLRLGNALTPDDRAAMHRLVYRVALNQGRLPDMLAHLEESAQREDTMAVRVLRVWNSILLGHPDPRLAETLEQFRGMLRAPATPRPLRRVVGRALLLAAIDRGDRTEATTLLPQVRAYETPTREDTAARPDPVPLVAKLWLDADRRPVPAASLAELDTALRAWRLDNVDLYRAAIVDLLAARLFAAAGDHAGAARIAGRRQVRNGDIPWPTVPQQLVVGREAVLAGDTVLARLALTHYVRWRAAASAELVPERRDAERLLASLGGPLDRATLAATKRKE